MAFWLSVSIMYKFHYSKAKNNHGVVRIAISNLPIIEIKSDAVEKIPNAVDNTLLYLVSFLLHQSLK